MTTTTGKAGQALAETLTRVLHGTIALASGVGIARLAWYIRQHGFVNIGAEHAPAIIGIPIIIVVTTCVISLLRALDGPFNFELPGLSVAGAAGTLVGWLSCLAGLAFVTRILW